MKKHIPILIAGLLISKGLYAQTVVLSTETIAAANIAQGSTNNVIYIVKMDVTVSPVTVATMQFTLTGTHDNNDLTTYRIYANSTASLAGATLLSSTPATFAAPHTYNDDIPDQTIAGGITRYFIITVFTDAAATHGNTIKLHGTTNPVIFTYTTAPTVINNQTDAAGVQTIVGSSVSISSENIAASNVAQGSANNIIYIAKVDVSISPVTVAVMQFTLTGTHDNNDLATYRIYVNGSPTLAGATLLSSNPATFAAPNTYIDDIPDQTIAIGNTRYFIITIFTDVAATAGNTIKLDGAINPVIFTYTTAPAVTNNQTDAAGIQTIQAAGITLSTETISATPIYRNTTNNIIYILKTNVTAFPVTVATLQFTLTGTHDNNDLTTYRIYVNSTPSLTGATLISINPATFAAPNIYNDDIPDQAIAAGITRYFIITVAVDATATFGNTVKINGAVNPVVLTYTTAPPVTNNQTDAAGTHTISNLLPVSLLSFTATQTTSKHTFLQWQTANEINTKHFAVEWSADGLIFTAIALVTAAGNSTQNKHYNYVHSFPVDDNNFYRLKMSDMDGSFTYSPVVLVKITGNKMIPGVFPNPVTDILHLHILSPTNEQLRLHLFNGEGKPVAAKTIIIVKGNNKLTWNIQAIAAGVYYISCDNNYFAPIPIFKQ